MISSLCVKCLLSILAAGCAYLSSYTSTYVVLTYSVLLEGGGLVDSSEMLQDLLKHNKMQLDDILHDNPGPRIHYRLHSTHLDFIKMQCLPIKIPLKTCFYPSRFH